MGSTLGNLKHKRRPISPRNIKRRSDYVKNYSNQVMVGGERHKTDYGFMVEGFKGKSFETYFEYMEAGTATPAYKHEKKDKTVRVLSGILHVILKDGDSASTVKAIPGDEIALERGKEYRLSTSADSVELFVAQNAKYEAALQVVDDSVAIKKDVAASLLKEPSRRDRVESSVPQIAGTQRRGSKAKEQLAALRDSIKNRVIPGKTLEPASSSQAVYGTNPRPGMGNFDADGAG